MTYAELKQASLQELMKKVAIEAKDNLNIEQTTPILIEINIRTGAYDKIWPIKDRVENYLRDICEGRVPELFSTLLTKYKSHLYWLVVT